MSISRFFYGQYLKLAIPRQKRKILMQPGPTQLTRSDWERSLRQPTEFYYDCFRFFHQHLSTELKDHRFYFWTGRRGFNEDAMHVMWSMLFAEFKPANFLEIGVFRGQTISLAALLARRNGVPCLVQGISPFDGAGDSLCKYNQNFDYLEDVRANFKQFSLPEPELLKAYSTDAAAATLIRSIPRDMIYIDGNHDWEVVVKDWEVCSQSVKIGGVIVMDDSASNTAYKPPLFATAGLPDPSRFTDQIDRKQFREILHVGHNRAFQRIA